MTANDFFCGCGGIGLALKRAGFDVAWACDFDKYAVQSYRRNVDDCVIQADVRGLSYNDVPKADLWAFGFPCQDLSVGGQRKGFRFRCEECEHEWLLDDGGMICPNCGCHNVRATTRSGLFFEMMRLLDETKENESQRMPQILLAENVKGVRKYIPTIKEEFEKRGYTMFSQLYNSKWWDVPQHRERYYFVGVKDCSRDFVFPTEQHEYTPLLSSVLDVDVADKYYISDEKARLIIEQAVASLGQLDDVHAVLTPERVNKRQNGPRAKKNEKEMFTLTAQDVHGVILSDRALLPVRISKCGRKFERFTDISNSVAARDYKGFGNQVMSGVAEIKLVGKLDINAHDYCKRVYSADGLSPTVTTCPGGYTEIKVLDTTKYRVRRLTPIEYGRLQAFPMDDGWVQAVSDSQAYKQFGNSVTINVVAAIAETIKDYLDFGGAKNVA